MEFKTKEELATFLTDLQGQMENLQQTVDKLSPVVEEETTPVDETLEETPGEEEVNEIDALLQGE